MIRLALPALPCLIALSAAAAAPCVATSERGGVRMCAQEVPGSPVHAVSAAAVLDAPLPALAAVLADISAYPGMMPPTEEAHLLWREGGAAVYHMVLRPPFTTRRDYCIRVAISALPGGAFRSEFDTTTDPCPPQRPHVVRITRNRGAWLLEPAPGGKTRVSYQAHTEFGGLLPAWIFNAALLRSLPDVFHALETAAAQPRYARATTLPPALQ